MRVGTPASAHNLHTTSQTPRAVGLAAAGEWASGRALGYSLAVARARTTQLPRGPLGAALTAPPATCMYPPVMPNATHQPPAGVNLGQWVLGALACRGMAQA